MPVPKHCLKHPARKVVGLLLFYYSEHGTVDFDEFDDDYVRDNDITAHGISLNIRNFGLEGFLVRCEVPEGERVVIMDYLRRQLLREDLMDIIGIGPSINRELKQWVARGMPDRP